MRIKSLCNATRSFLALLGFNSQVNLPISSGTCSFRSLIFDGFIYSLNWGRTFIVKPTTSSCSMTKNINVVVQWLQVLLLSIKLRVRVSYQGSVLSGFWIYEASRNTHPLLYVPIGQMVNRYFMFSRHLYGPHRVVTLREKERSSTSIYVPTTNMECSTCPGAGKPVADRMHSGRAALMRAESATALVKKNVESV